MGHTVVGIMSDQRTKLLKLLLISASIIVLTSLSCSLLIVDWSLEYGTATMYVNPVREIGAQLKIYMRGYFNTSIGNISIDPSVNFTYKVIDCYQINLEIHNNTLSGPLRITVDRIRVTNTSLPTRFPFGVDGESYLVVVPSEFDAIVIGNSEMIAKTSLGEMRVFDVSYVIEYRSGLGRYVDYPYHWHTSFRIQDFLLILLATASTLIVGTIGGIFNRDLRERYPFMTTLIVMISSMVYVRWGTAYSVMYRDYRKQGALWIVFLLCPFFHESYHHLANNLPALIPLGLVLETGLEWKSWKTRTGLIIFCVYASSWISDFFLHRPIPPGGFGLSFLIIWLSLLFVILVNERRQDLLRNKWILVYSLIVGYCLLTPTYGWIAQAIINPIEPSNLGLARSHSTAFVTGLLTLWGFNAVLRKKGRSLLA